MVVFGLLIDVLMFDNVLIIVCLFIMFIEIIKVFICFKLSLGLLEN